MNRYLRSNQGMWDVWTRHHVTSPFYAVEEFKRTGARRQRRGLDALETRLVGDVTGRSLLHLQCHFGLDTLSWAKRGAAVTGVDFSEEAIGTARALAAEVGIPATFVLSDVYDLPERLHAEFDIVFASHGVLCWLPDLDRWGRVVAHFLRPGGRLCLIDGHPFPLVFDDARSDRDLRVAFPYFNPPSDAGPTAGEPLRFERRGSYAVPDGDFDSVMFEWVHPLSEVVGALLRAGLHLESFEEYPYAGWAMFPWMEARPDGMWQFPRRTVSLPLMFSLVAAKPAPPARDVGGGSPG
jgi:SAM-dependent methyltransferase